MPPAPDPLAELVHNASSLRALAYDLTGDLATADDAVQEASLVALRRPPPKNLSVAGWVRAVVTSCALDLRRAATRRLRRERRAARAELCEGDDPAHTNEQIELHTKLLTAVSELSEPYRTAVWLRYYELLQPRQIAARTGTPIGTVKLRLWRALHILRRQLDQRYGRARWLAVLLPLRIPNTKPLAATLTAGVLVMPKHVSFVTGALVVLLLAIGMTWSRASPNASEDITPRPGPLAAVSPPPEQPTRTPIAQPPHVATAPAASAGDGRGALTVHVRWHDGTPASGVAVLTHALDEPRVDRADVRIVTDGAGVAHVRGLHAGQVAVGTDRGGDAEAEVVAGQVQTCELVVPRGIDVVGTVVDGRERPIAAAQIVVVSDRIGWLSGQTVTRSEADGSFHVRSVNPSWSVGARANGLAPSPLIDLETQPHAAEAATVKLRLQLIDPGGTLAGRVCDDRGEPVASAEIAVGRCLPPTPGPDWMTEHWSAELLTTDANGTFRCRNLAPGRVPIAVRAIGHATWSGEVECRATGPATATTSDVLVTLTRAARVQGVVRLGDGTPVGGAVVTLARHWRSSDSQRAQLAFPPAEVRSGADGSFELDNVMAGELALVASKRASERRVAELGTCHATLQTMPGETSRWDPRAATRAPDLGAGHRSTRTARTLPGGGDRGDRGARCRTAARAARRGGPRADGDHRVR